MQTVRLAIVVLGVLLAAFQLPCLHAQGCLANWDPRPCSCGVGIVVCGKDSNIISTAQLKKVFTAPSINRTVFMTLLSIESLTLENFNGSNIFGRFSFQDIYFRHTQIKQISDDAFKGHGYVRILYFYNNKFETFNFNCLKHINPDYFSIEESPLVDVPSKSFQNNSLKKISLSFNKLQMIRTRTFSGMPQLQEIWVTNNNITTIEEKAFDLLNLDQPLGIWLRNNQISSKGIHENAFPSGLRLRSLSLSSNLLTTLPRKIFEPILNVMVDLEFSELNVDDNPFICDSSLEWLVEKPQIYKNIVQGLVCRSGKTLDDLTLDDVLN